MLCVSSRLRRYQHAYLLPRLSTYNYNYVTAYVSCKIFLYMHIYATDECKHGLSRSPVSGTVQFLPINASRRYIFTDVGYRSTTDGRGGQYFMIGGCRVIHRSILLPAQVLKLHKSTDINIMYIAYNDTASSVHQHKDYMYVLRTIGKCIGVEGV
jgi:hypothetical protein